ncbi:MAG: molybdenum cofactor biosynthesis protein A [Methanomethylovorans sp. PtaU1.Bin073]|nr:MAG: molybdenum cofactor biosynthesis protein A [Methanomethylovorans sp. PtaU1.Bin073]
MYTKSLCPECAKVVNAKIIEEDGKIIMQKSCNEHGDFKDVYWSDAKLYRKFERLAWTFSGISDVASAQNTNCPYECGLCPSHKTCTILANIDVTNRCNMSCPVCFANAQKSGMLYEPEKEQIISMMSMLRHQEPVPCSAVQFSGGEPTVREDLPELIAAAKKHGFIQIQIATNGIKLAQSTDYAKRLVMEGLNTVYLQFDGVSSDPYVKMRGFDAYPIKKRTISNCREAGLNSVTLVPTLAKDVNDHQVGDIIRFAADNRDVVKGVNFQPVSFTGRIDYNEREKKRITIPDLTKLVDEQTAGEIPPEAWYPVSFVVPISKLLEKIHHKSLPYLTIHPHCGAATYLFVEDLKLIPITKFIDVEGFMEFVRETVFEYNEKTNKWILLGKVLRKVPSFIDTKHAPKSIDVGNLIIHVLKNGSDEVVKEFHRKAMFLGAMHFQDMFNFDIHRVQQCGIHYATPDGRVISFCTYNTLHRKEVEARFSKPYSISAEENSKIPVSFTTNSIEIL